MTLILHSVKITLNTSFEVRNRWFQLLCRHRRYSLSVHLCAIRIYWYVRHPLEGFVYNVQRPNAIFLLRDLVLAMLCFKKNFPLVYSQLSSSLRRAHVTVTRSRHGDRHHGYRLEGIFNYRLLPRKVVR